VGGKQTKLLLNVSTKVKNWRSFCHLVVCVLYIIECTLGQKDGREEKAVRNAARQSNVRGTVMGSD